MANVVTVGCKLPYSFMIQLNGKSAVLNGANNTKIIGGHGITENVDAELFNAWYQANKERALVKNGFVFAYENKADTKAAAKERSKNKSGLEPINPKDKNNGVEQAKD